MGDVQPFERRLVLRLLNHWREWAGERGMPEPGDVVREALGDCLPHCFMLTPTDDGVLTFTFVGSEHAGEIGADLVGRPLDLAPANSLLGQAVRAYRDVMARRVPITLGGEFTDRNGRQILYRSILCPLGDGTPRALIGAANGRGVVVPIEQMHAAQ
ncbi:MAG: PAS domain-containing protein [Gemmatimonas sp.]